MFGRRIQCDRSAEFHKYKTNGVENTAEEAESEGLV